MRYRFGQAALPTRKHYSLRTASPVVAPTPRKPQTLAGTIRGTHANEIATLDRLQARRTQQRSTRGQRFRVDAPAQSGLVTLARLNIRVADSDRMPGGFFGTTALKIDADSVDLNRVRSGLLNFALDHDTERLAGRVPSSTIEGGVLYAQIEVADVPNGHKFLAEYDAGLRQGVSPGFLVLDATMTEGKDGELEMTVTRFEPFEYSSTAIPRGKNARVVSRYSQGGKAMTMTDTGQPKLVSTSDIPSLEVEACRVALKGSTGKPKQRGTMRLFVDEYDRLIGTGMDANTAATRAAERAKAAV